MKTLKFRDHLVQKILNGEKTVTWRLFDEKNLQVGDNLVLQNWNTGEQFAKAEITGLKEKTLGELTEADFEGHEKYESEADMYKRYQEYYKDKVNKDTVVKIIKFRLLEGDNKKQRV